MGAPARSGGLQPPRLEGRPWARTARQTALMGRRRTGGTRSVFAAMLQPNAWHPWGMSQMKVSWHSKLEPRTTAMLKHRPFADGSGNAPYRPEARVQDRPNERTERARKRSSAKRVGWAMSGRLQNSGRFPLSFALVPAAGGT